MPTRPKSPCPVCRRVGCDNPDHKRVVDYRARMEAERIRRPYSYAERKRRGDTVRAWVEVHGYVCPICGKETADLTADHIVPYAKTGDENTPLQVMCRSCNAKKGAR